MELLLGPFECKFAKGCRFEVGVLFDPDLFLGRLFLGVLKLLEPILPKAAETRETGSFRRSIDPERPRFLPADEIVDFAASVGSLDFLADA
jgi:hypothetical protein